MIPDAAIFGLLNSGWTALLILLSFLHEPRIWLSDFPQEMQAVVPPKSAAEKRLERLWAVPILGSMFLLPFAYALWWHSEQDLGYLDAFLFFALCGLCFNVVDLVVLDWLVSVWWNPPWMRLEGAEAMAHHDNYWFHFVGFLQGLPILTFAAAIFALPFVWL
ncbi:MAG: hypothetical protein AAGK22_08225 [Acidobacteriota bacterium]